MPSFLNWHSRSGLGQAPSRGGSSQAASCPEANGDPASYLIGLCLGNDAPTLLRPLVPTCSLILKLLNGQATPAAAAKPLREANAFLAGSDRPERLLEFSLAVHSDQEGMQTFAWNMRTALTALCQAKGLREIVPPVEAALEQCRRDVEGVAELGQEIWELHAYFVFLDVKGDRALLETVAAQLCRALRCTAQDLALSMVRTERWVEGALGMLAAQACGEMLQQRHVKALQQWRAAWVERMRCSPELQRLRVFGAEEEKPGEWFWVNYFQQLGSVTWADFLDGFQDFYLRGRCPVDIAEQLRAGLDPDLVQVVRRSDWHALLKGHDNAASFIDFLLSKVLADIADRIYRSKPLDAELLLAEALSPAGGAAEASSAAPPPEDPPHRPADGRRPPKQQPRGGLGAPGGAAGSRDPEGAAAARPPAKDVAITSTEDGVDECEQELVEPFQQSQIVTPLEPRGINLPLKEGKHTTWNNFCRELSGKSPCWWNAGKRPGPHQRSLQASALAAVSSSLACTRRALVLRVVSGSLADSRPLLRMPSGAPQEGAAELPAVVITANDTQLSGVAQFGRDAPRRMQVPDLPMSEPIASRSHFSVVYEPTTDRYNIMDAGSKWGTFLKVTKPVCLSCGDWIRLGNAELVIRHCGGGCANHRWHAADKMNSTRQFGKHRPRPEGVGAEQQSCEEREAEDALQGMLGGVRRPAWPTPVVQVTPPQAAVAGRATASGGKRPAEPGLAAAQEQPPQPAALASLVPVPPLEIDFIAGPRMGEKLVLTERVSTMGRSDATTAQITDATLANISRVHCIFEYVGNRWHLRDNNSTNGTWQRLSCVLQPSVPRPLSPGTSVLAGTHEFLVEEAELTHWWLPSAACGVLDEMRQRHRSAAK